MTYYELNTRKFMNLLESNNSEYIEPLALVEYVISSYTEEKFNVGKMLATLIRDKKKYPSVEIILEFTALFLTYNTLSKKINVDIKSNEMLNLKEKIKNTWDEIFLIEN